MAGIMELLTMARDNKVDAIRALVARGTRIDACNQMGQTALHIAALWGHKEAVEACVELGCDPNITNTRGTTPLHFAAGAKQNTVEVCQVLLRLGANKEALDMMGRAPYELASSDEVRVLLGGPDPRIFQLCAAGDARGLAALFGARTTTGGAVSVRVMDAQHRTPLNLAVASGDLDTVKVVLAQDLSVLDIPDGTGDTALHIAAGCGHIPILQYLLKRRPESLNSFNLDGSEYSAGNWMLNGEVVEPLDKTPLAIAVAAGEQEAAQLLLGAGAEVDVLDFEKRTPLLSALEEGYTPLVHLLLSHGANPNAPSQDFVSALHFLAQRGDVQLIEPFIAAGARVNAANEDGWTPLHLAARGGKLDRVNALLKGGADVHVTNKQGNTALHLAALNGHVPVVAALLQHDADKALVNKAGKTAVEVAKNDATRAALQ